VSDKGSEVTDDAYIAFIYARNLAEGHGLRFNADDPKAVEGFSSPAHVLLTALAFCAGIEPLAFTRGLGLVAFLTVPVAFAVAMKRSLGGPFGRASCISLICWSGIAFLPETGSHLTSGMETILFASVLGWLGAWTLVALRLTQWRSGLVAVGTILILAVSVTRPEGFLIAVGTLGGLAVATALLRGGFDTRGGLTILSLGALCYGAYLGWKVVYFGSALPNPYYVKAHNAIFGATGSWLPGLPYVAGFVQSRLLPALVPMMVLAYAISLPRKTILAAAALLSTPLAILFAYSLSIHETATSLRYEFPLLMPFVLSGSLCVHALWEKNAKIARCVLLLIAYGVYLLGSVRPSMVLRWSASPVTAASAWVHARPDNAWSRMGHDLSKTGLGPRATVLLSAAGQIPYFSRFFTVDWIGLNTERLSGRHRLGLDEVWAYIDSYKPDVVYSFLPPAEPAGDSLEKDGGLRSAPVQAVLTKGLGGELFIQWDRSLVRSMFFREMLYIRERYIFGAAYDAGHKLHIFAYVRRESPYCGTIIRTLRESSLADYSDLAGLYGSDPRRLAGGCSVLSRERLNPPDNSERQARRGRSRALEPTPDEGT
jgi:hypothetical protein